MDTTIYKSRKRLVIRGCTVQGFKDWIDYLVENYPGTQSLHGYPKQLKEAIGLVDGSEVWIENISSNKPSYAWNIKPYTAHPDSEVLIVNSSDPLAQRHIHKWMTVHWERYCELTTKYLTSYHRVLVMVKGVEHATELLRSAFNYGMTWAGGGRDIKYTNSTILCFTNSSTITFQVYSDIDENDPLITTNEFTRWLDIHFPISDFLTANKVYVSVANPQHSEALQRRAFQHGLNWFVDKNKNIKHTNAEVLMFNKTDKNITHCERFCVANDTSYTQLTTEQFHQWLDCNFPLNNNDGNNNNKPTPTPKKDNDMTTPTTDSPYELMVQSVTQRVLQQIPATEVDMTKVDGMIAEQLGKAEQRLKEMVDAKTQTLGHVKIVLEDRRKSPTEIKEINEPVHRAMPDIIGILKAGCWACAVGPTGSGKTLGALQYARVAGIKIICVKQMTRILAPHDLIGFIDANGHYRSGAWTNGILGRVYDNSSGQIPTPDTDGNEPAIIIVDEMDNSNENIVMLIKALQTGIIQMPYGPQRVNPNLSVMATMNTWGTGATREYVGRMAQDAALLNEFSFVEWDYDTDFEWQLLEGLFKSYKDTGEYNLQHMMMLHAMFKGMRGKAEQQKVRVIISTRNIINTAKKLIENPEWTIRKVLKMDVFKGLKDEDITRIECPEQWTKVASGGSKKHGNKAEVPAAKNSDIPF